MTRIERIAEKRAKLLESYPNLSQELSTIRGEVVTKIPDLLSQAQETLKGKGCQVCFAKTKEDAQKILAQLLEGQQQVVRSYSNTQREINLDSFLENINIKVNKTNINEILLELAKEFSNGHPLLLDKNFTKEKVIELLQRYLNTDEVNEPNQLSKLLHQQIKQQIIDSEFAITGINSIAAENGTIILAEDEGNGRAVSNLPYRHIVIAGIDKITNTVEEAMTAIQGATIYGLGRNNPTYYSLISGPSRTADIEFRMAYGMHGPKEVHVILVDNGRQELIQQGCGEVLKCIDCGSCYRSMAKLAQANNWSEVTLTPKGIALAIVQGKIALENPQVIEPFECPVAINAQGLQETLKKIKS